MNATGFILKERAGDFLGQIISYEFLHFWASIDPCRWVQAFEDAGVSECEQRGMESISQMVLLFLGERMYPFRQCLGFKDAEGNHLAAAGSAAGAARDMVSLGLDKLNGAVDDVAGE